MAEIVEITNYSEAKAWLETQDHQTQIWFAARCALRALPALGRYVPTQGRSPHKRKERFAIGSLRGVLAAAVSTRFSLPGTVDGTGFVRSAHSELNNLTQMVLSDGDDRVQGFDGAEAALNAAMDGASAVKNVAAGRSAVDGAISTFDIPASSDFPAICAALTADANSPNGWDQSLWPDRQMPNDLADDWQALKVHWNDHDADWSFWIKWYEKILNGQMRDAGWDLTRRIALDVTPKDWEAGQKAVAERIGDIEKRIRQEPTRVSPETIDAARVIPIFDRAPIVQASMGSLSETVSLRVDWFNRMHRPNEAIPFLDTLKRLPEAADRIAKILEEGRDAPKANGLLAIEVGRLRAEVEQLKVDLDLAKKELESLRKKPWYRPASGLLSTAVVYSLVSGLWILSGDDKSLEQRWNKLAVDLEYLGAGIWPEPEDRLTEPLRFELPDVEDT